MLYVKSVTVPANTPQNNPVEATVEIEEDVVAMIQVRFPPGPSGLTYCAIFYGNEQLFPHKDYDWLNGDNEAPFDILLWEVPEKPCTLRIKAANMDDTYDHTIIVRILALPKDYVYIIRRQSRIARIIELLPRLLFGI